MARARRAKPQLTESWDAMDEKDDFEDEIYSQEDERRERSSGFSSEESPKAQILTPRSDEAPASAEARNNAMRSSRVSDIRGASPPRKRMTRSSIEPELVMPSSPDALRVKQPNMRASTPHFRLNERSLTSDAGRFRPSRRRRDSHSDSDDDHHHSNREMTKEEAELDDKIDDTSDLNLPVMIWQRVVKPLLRYVGGVIGFAAGAGKPILGYILLGYLFVGMIVMGRNFLNNSITNALSPVCRIPGVSLLNLSFCPSTTPAISGPAKFDQLVQAQFQFQEVLETTAGGATLPLDMKRSEASIRDLKHVVQYSTLPSRNELVFEFAGFIDTARQASQDLSKFNSRIGRAVDYILSTNRWTLQVIDGVAASDASHGAISKWVSNNLDVFAPFRPVSLSQDVLMDQYLRHTSAVEEQILSLITEAQALLNILDNLDGRLDVIANIAMRDGVKANDNKEELFATLWTKLGGNRNSVAKLNQQLQLLGDVGSYRRLAWAHVAGTIVKLQAIRDNLEDLRERVALPETVGDKVPLEVHINNINLGIERLEQQRDASRKIEAENYARVVGRAEHGDRLID